MLSDTWLSPGSTCHHLVAPAITW